MFSFAPVTSELLFATLAFLEMHGILGNALKAFMFPGQGSQARGMGGPLFDRFKDVTAAADEILKYSIKDLCLSDPDKQLSNTRFAQPSLYVVNALYLCAKRAEGLWAPDYLIGHSLGEYNALQAAGCFDFETGLRLVHNRGEIMSKAVGGAMAAVINASQDEIEATLREHEFPNVAIANLNSPTQIVISGPRADILRAESYFSSGSMRYYPLSTSGAFHSKYMLPAQQEFSLFVDTIKFDPPLVPVISNLTGSPWIPPIGHGMAAQIASPVRWCDGVQYIMRCASEAGQEIDFEEIGHGDVLKKLVAAIRRDSFYGQADRNASPANGPIQSS